MILAELCALISGEGCFERGGGMLSGLDSRELTWKASQQLMRPHDASADGAHWQEEAGRHGGRFEDGRAGAHAAGQSRVAERQTSVAKRARRGKPQIVRRRMSHLEVESQGRIREHVWATWDGRNRERENAGQSALRASTFVSRRGQPS